VVIDHQHAYVECVIYPHEDNPKQVILLLLIAFYYWLCRWAQQLGFASHFFLHEEFLAPLLRRLWMQYGFRKSGEHHFVNMLNGSSFQPNPTSIQISRGLYFKISLAP
jgi:hypothetical protein